MKANQSIKNIILAHGFVAVFISLLMFFIGYKHYAQEFLASSFLFNIYLRLLNVNFSSLQPINLELDAEELAKPNPILLILSGVRSFMVAVILAIFILKFNFNLALIAAAFFVYKVVLFIGGFKQAQS